MCELLALVLQIVKGAVEVNLFRPLWFTWKGKDGYGGGGGYLQIKLPTKKQGKWQEHKENTGGFGINWSVATLNLSNCYISYYF